MYRDCKGIGRSKEGSPFDEMMVDQIGLRRTVLCYHGPKIAAKTWKEKKALEAMLVNYLAARILDHRYDAVMKALHIKNNQWALICGHARRVPGLMSPPEKEGGFPVFHDLVGAKSVVPRAKARTNITPASPVASALRRAGSPRVQSQPFKPAPASHGLKSSPDRQPRFFNVFVRAGGRPPASHSVLGTQTRLRTSPVAPHHATARRPLIFRELPTIWEHDGEEQDTTEAVERSNLSMRSHGSQPARTGDQEGVLSSSPSAAAFSSQQSSGSKLTTEHTQSPTGSPASMGSQKMVPRQIPLARKLAGQQRQAHSVPATKYTTLALAQTLVPKPGSPGSRGSSEASKTAPVGAPPPPGLEAKEEVLRLSSSQYGRAPAQEGEEDPEEQDQGGVHEGKGGAGKSVLLQPQLLPRAGLDIGRGGGASARE